MKLAISACAEGLDAEVDRRFGRAPWFVFYDLDTDTPESVKNEGCDGLHGAGTSTAQRIVDRGTDVVLTGDCGPKARALLDAAGVEVVLSVEGTVRDAIQAFRGGRTPTTAAPMPFVGGGGGGGRGRGAGRGGGGGCGGGGGPGRGMGRGRGGGEPGVETGRGGGGRGGGGRGGAGRGRNRG